MTKMSPNQRIDRKPWARMNGQFRLQVRDGVFDLHFVPRFEPSFFSMPFRYALAVQVFLTHPEIGITHEDVKKAVATAQEGTTAIIPVAVSVRRELLIGWQKKHQVGNSRALPPAPLLKRTRQA